MRRSSISFFSALAILLTAQTAWGQAQSPQGASAPPRQPDAPQADTTRGITAAGANKVYKSVDAQGRVTYSSVPQGNSKAIEPTPLSSGITPFKAPVAQAAMAQPARATAGSEAAAGAAPGNRWAAIAQAQDALKAAQNAQAQGVAPLGGERLATGNGGTHFSPLYDQRQAGLADAVQKAQKNLEDAQKQP